MPPAADDTVFSYTYTLPVYLQAVAYFLAVAGALDTNFTVDYANVLRTTATFLQSIHDPRLQDGVTALSPPKPSTSSFFSTACEASGSDGSLAPPPPGIRIAYSVTGPRGAINELGAILEYGAVEKFSGYSSIDGYYEIVGDDYSTQVFSKLQIRPI